jgi:hypothetical protein
MCNGLFVMNRVVKEEQALKDNGWHKEKTFCQKMQAKYCPLNNIS